jgi:hypothetical protein
MHGHMNVKYLQAYANWKCVDIVYYRTMNDVTFGGSLGPLLK